MTDDEPCETFKVLKSSAAEVHCWAAGSLAFSFPTFGTWLPRYGEYDKDDEDVDAYQRMVCDFLLFFSSRCVRACER